MTPEQVNALSTPELIALYNRLTGKSITRFASRAKGASQVLKALAAQPKARTVNGSASGRTGRPKAQYSVQLTEERAKSKPNPKSDRWALIEWLRAQPNATASIDAIEAHFKKRMRGVAQKLIAKLWLKRL